MPGKDHGKQTRLASIAGASKQVVNHWITGITTTMDYDYASIINQRLGYRIQWLITGKGPMRDGDDKDGVVAVEVEPSAAERQFQATPISLQRRNQAKRSFWSA
jgi:hypothetical protein